MNYYYYYWFNFIYFSSSR